MSYDIRLGVKVEGAKDCYAVVAEPEYSSPTYNLGKMFRACTGWDYNQDEWYNVKDVLPLIEKGIHELTFNRKEYEQYNPENGWGSISSALEALESMLKCIADESGGHLSWNEIPIECLYIHW